MIYRFGRCELDTERLELCRDGQLQPVEPKVFSLLVFLIENRDHVISKDDLINEVWDGRIVSDASLTSRISAARKAVGDTGRSQSIIRTFPKRGLRFIASVEQDEPGRPSTSAPANETEPVHIDLHDRPSIAVLPFANLNDDPGQEYLSDGITDDIITGLSLFRGLLVIARNSVFVYKGAATDIRQVARELGVRYVLEGSVRRAGDQLRVSAQLIEATTGGHVWVERYDREFGDIFALQDEITNRVVGAISPAIIDAEMQRALRRRPDNLDAHECQLRGLWHLRRFKKPDNAEAQFLFRKAIEADPNFAQAYAWLAFSMWIDVWLTYSDAPKKTLDDAYQAATRATALDDRDEAGHIALGFVCTFMRRSDAALAGARRAVELNPGNAMSHVALGVACVMGGRYEEAIIGYSAALRLNPTDPLRFGSYGGRAMAYYQLKQYDEAIDDARQALRIRYGYIMTRAVLTASLARLERYAEAAAEFAEILRLKPDFSVDSFANYPWRDAARDHLFDGLRKAGFPE